MIDEKTVSYLNKRFTDVVIEELKEMTKDGIVATWTAKQSYGNIYFNGKITETESGYEMTLKHPHFP